MSVSSTLQGGGYGSDGIASSTSGMYDHMSQVIIR